MCPEQSITEWINVGRDHFLRTVKYDSQTEKGRTTKGTRKLKKWSLEDQIWGQDEAEKRTFLLFVCTDVFSVVDFLAF